MSLGFRFLPCGGFDRLNHRSWAFSFYREVVSTGSTTESGLSVSTVWWFRQAQPPKLGFRFLPYGGFDRLNHRSWVFSFYRMVVSTGSTTEAGLSVSTVWWFRQAQPPSLGFGFLPYGGFDRLNHRVRFTSKCDHRAWAPCKICRRRNMTYHVTH
jgi:hypothetical protein